MNELGKAALIVVVTLVGSYGAFGSWWVARIDDRVLWIADNYVKREELLDIKTDIKDLRQFFREELRDAIRQVQKDTKS